MGRFISVKKCSLHLQWFIFLISSFFIALVASWMLLAKVNFAYPLLYDYAGIGNNIVAFAPKNKIKPHFDQSSRAEHLVLFEGIVTSIQQQGKGLEALRYHPQKDTAIPLLTKAEIIHLQDVANLYDKMTWLAWGALLVWLSSMLVQRRSKVDVFSVSWLPYVFVLPFIVLVVLTVGAEKIFYNLHMLVFPEGHQWFFYYEESLMSMMMKAPDLFAYIAVMLLFLAVVLIGMGFWVYRRVPLYLPKI